MRAPTTTRSSISRGRLLEPRHRDVEMRAEWRVFGGSPAHCRWAQISSAILSGSSPTPRLLEPLHSGAKLLDR